VGFQICYDFGRAEHAVTWRPGLGFAHSVIDAGDEDPLHNRVSILRPPVGTPPWSDIARVFDERSEPLEPDLRQLIRDKLTERVETTAVR
jgi:hypothetical protein